MSKLIELYRDFEISEYWLPVFAKYAYAHLDYGGEGDPRYGHADTIQECKAEIDEYWEGIDNEG